MNMRCRRICTICKEKTGVAATEFGLLAVPFVLILMGALDLGYQIYVRSVLEGTLVDVARRASLENPAFAATGVKLEDRIEATIKGKVNSVARDAVYTVSIKNFSDFTGIGKPEKLTTDVNGNGSFDESDGDCWKDLNGNSSYDTEAGRDGVGGADDVVYYEVTMVMPRLFPMAGLMGASDQYNISANTLFRSQPYAVQVVPDIKCGTVS